MHTCTAARCSYESLIHRTEQLSRPFPGAILRSSQRVIFFTLAGREDNPLLILPKYTKRRLHFRPARAVKAAEHVVPVVCTSLNLGMHRIVYCTKGILQIATRVSVHPRTVYFGFLRNGKTAPLPFCCYLIRPPARVGGKRVLV